MMRGAKDQGTRVGNTRKRRMTQSESEEGEEEKKEAIWGELGLSDQECVEGRIGGRNWIKEARESGRK